MLDGVGRRRRRRRSSASGRCGSSCSPTARTATERKAILGRARARATSTCVIGTHALIQGDVAFASLGVVVIDEQHRFGVEQRAALREKGDRGATPDVLVMTATPIPRTAAMTVYGDLDVSVLDEMPPGRTPVTTPPRSPRGRGGPGVGGGARPRWPPVARPTWCAR